VDNFPISGRRPDRDFIIAHARIKRAAAVANAEAAGWTASWPMPSHRADAIINGHYLAEFVVDRFQAGAGTSHNMNSNEVIANLANVALVARKATPSRAPKRSCQHGAKHQRHHSTAIRLAALAKLPRLMQAVEAMAAEFETLGQRRRILSKAAAPFAGCRAHHPRREFAAYAFTLRRCNAQLGARAHCCATSASALGGRTGLNTAPGYVERAAAVLARSPVSRSSGGDLSAQMQSMGDLQQLSNAIRALALEVARIANDMRLLASGPRTGFAEITLPRAARLVDHAGQGESGDVRDAQPGVLQVLGQDTAIALMVQAGQLELNVMMPALGSALFDAMDWLTHALDATTRKGVHGLTVDRARCRELLHTSVGLATLLNTAIGYSAAAEVAKESARSGRPVRDIVAEKD